MKKLASSAASRISGALRPWTAAAYERTFKMFLAFVIFCKFQDCTTETTIVLYLEFLIQNGLSAVSLHNALSVLQHYFALYSWNVANLSSRKVVLMCKSAKNNLPLKPKVRGIFTVDMLERLLHLTSDLPNAETFKALFLFAFYGFFRLASLAPPSLSTFDPTRYPLVKDIIWASQGMQYIQKTAKNMQSASEYRLVQLPRLSNVQLCPVVAVQTMIKRMALSQSDPLFMIKISTGKQHLTAHVARKVLKSLVIKMDLNPRDFGFHTFRRSGASWAFSRGVPLEKIKIHGHWHSEAVWSYLPTTFCTSSAVTSAFQKFLF